MNMSLQKTVITLALISVWFIHGCAGTAKEATDNTSGNRKLSVTDISKGLPLEGLWRQGISLVDMNNDGLLDIVAPPQRKGLEAWNRPFIFLRDSIESKWTEAAYAFPKSNNYGYGGVAAGDLNRDGLMDIVLAVHARRIILLMNDGRGGFVESAFPVKEDFRSRAVVITDINGDGWPDIAALSEAPFSSKDYIPKGVLLGINIKGRDWDVQIIKESMGLFGDSLVAGDVAGDANMDIVIAPLTNVKEQKKVLWSGDGKGGFNPHLIDHIGDRIPSAARTGDIDGDGRAETVFLLSGIGANSTMTVSVLKWTGEGFRDLSSGLLTKDNLLVIDVADIDGDGRDEIIMLCIDGLHLFKYIGEGWTELISYSLPPAETQGAYDLRAGMNRDGSGIIAYNQGGENPAFSQGIKAFIVK